MQRHAYTPVLIATALTLSLFGPEALARSRYFNQLDSQCAAFNGAASKRNSAVTCSAGCHDSSYTLTRIGSDYRGNGYTITATNTPTLCTAGTPPTNQAPVLDAVPNSQATLNQVMTAIALNARNEAGQQLKFTASGLPAGVRVVDSSATDSVATLEGTPTASGKFNVTVTATDNGTPPLSGNTRFVLTVGSSAPTGTAPVLKLIGDRNFALNQAFSLTISATDADAQDSLSFSAVGLPAGVSLIDNRDRTALISGTPTSAGVSAVSVTVTDSSGLRDTETFNLTIQDSGAGGNYTDALQSEASWDARRKSLSIKGEIQTLDDEGGDDDDDDDVRGRDAREAGRYSAQTCSPYQGQFVAVSTASGAELGQLRVDCYGKYRATLKLQAQSLACTLSTALKDPEGQVIDTVQPETAVRIKNSPAKNCKSGRD